MERDESEILLNQLISIISGYKQLLNVFEVERRRSAIGPSRPSFYETCGRGFPPASFRRVRDRCKEGLHIF